MEIKIESIIILLTNGQDRISFKTNLPSPYPQMKYDCDLRIDTEMNHAEEYCKTNFPGIPVEIINSRNSPYKFTR